MSDHTLDPKTLPEESAEVAPPDPVEDSEPEVGEDAEVEPALAEQFAAPPVQPSRKTYPRFQQIETEEGPETVAVYMPACGCGERARQGHDGGVCGRCHKAILTDEEKSTYV